MRVFIVLFLVFVSIFDFKYWIKPESNLNACFQPLSFPRSCTYLSQQY